MLNLLILGGSDRGQLDPGESIGLVTGWSTEGFCIWEGRRLGCDSST